MIDPLSLPKSVKKIIPIFVSWCGEVFKILTPKEAIKVVRKIYGKDNRSLSGERLHKRCLQNFITYRFLGRPKSHFKFRV